ncbi:MAG TPA: selenium metabolism-associated LysR family transcriptional regulator [Thermoanaerobaculia bacterium]|nr:selenium metabolism-associated LysR family transcriptional regulator [Thermoanaerobaculia bacterium]
MDLKLLEIFCCVYEEGNFSRAADRLNLSQPTISEHIKSLETFFGTPLFDRLGRTIHPTGAGEVLYARGRAIVELKQSVIDAMHHYLDRLEGELRIGASNVPGEYLLPRVIGRFHHSHPRIRVQVMIGDSEQIIEGVVDGRYEIGFVGSRPRQPGLELRKFASDRLVLAVPAGAWNGAGAMSLEDLRKMPLLIREQGSGTREELEKRLHDRGAALADFNVVAELGSTAAIREAIKAGVGAAIVSHLAIADDVAAGAMTVVPVREIGTLERDLYLVTDPRRVASPARTIFLEALAEQDQSKTRL